MNHEIALHLLKLGAVKFSLNKPFNYASGLCGPIYCDNRMILGHVEFRKKVVLNFINLINNNNLVFDIVGGIATAGIPHAAFIADRLNLPMVYIRPKPKGHGKMNQVEGDFFKNQKVLLIEDLVNQGASLEDAITGTSAAELLVTDCLCIVDYETSESCKRIKNLNIKLHALTNFTVLVNVAFELKLINEIEKRDLDNWHKNPVSWSQNFLENQ